MKDRIIIDCRPIFYFAHWKDGDGWVRFFNGRALQWRDYSYGLNFSQRYGYTKYLKLFGKIFSISSW